MNNVNSGTGVFSSLRSLVKKKRLLIIFGLVAIFGGMFGATYAAFMDVGEVKGSTITVGSSDIKMLSDVSGDITEANLVDTLIGPSFENISQNWTGDYLMKLFNNASAPVDLSTVAFYETVNDPDDLRQDVYVELIEWVDMDNNGLVDDGELGVNYGKKTIVKWKTEGFNLMSLDSGEILGLILRFSVENLSDTKQGAGMLFDFEFNAVGHE